MKKFTFLFAAFVAVAFSAGAQSLTLPYFEDFNGVAGESVESASKMPEILSTTEFAGYGDYTSMVKVYAADKKIKFGTSKLKGEATTLPFAATGTVTVTFKACAWPAVYQNVGKTADIVFTYNGESKKVTVKESTFPVTDASLDSYSVTFSAAPTASSLSIASDIATATNTKDVRFFLDDLGIKDGVSGVAQEVAAQLNLYVADNIVNFNTEKAVNVSVYSMTGAQIYNKVSTVGSNSIRINNAGLYIVKIGNKAVKVRI